MSPKIRTILQLYENTLASNGIPRREEMHTPQTSDHRLEHCRFLIDRLLAGEIQFSEPRLLHEVGVICGVLLAERIFSIPALENHADQMHDVKASA